MPQDLCDSVTVQQLCRDLNTWGEAVRRRILDIEAEINKHHPEAGLPKGIGNGDELKPPPFG